MVNFLPEKKKNKWQINLPYDKTPNHNQFVGQARFPVIDAI